MSVGYEGMKKPNNNMMIILWIIFPLRILLSMMWSHKTKIWLIIIPENFTFLLVVISVLCCDKSTYIISLSPSQGRCMISWGSTTAQCARAASAGALMSASTPSSTNRSAPPWRRMTVTGARPDNTSPQTAVKVRWLMSHPALSSENETLAESKPSQSAFSFILIVRQTFN